MATARKPRKAAPRKTADATPEDHTADTVTVKVRNRCAVYWNGEQRSGTIRGVDKPTAARWAQNGWVQIT
jgi:hypothetical protein